MTSDNPFATTDVWETSLSGGVLKKGNYLVEIIDVEDGTNSKNNPQLIVKFECDQGYITKWENYHGEFLNRIAALYQNSGTKLPQEGEFDPNDNCRLNAVARNRLIGKKVGIVVIEEARNDDPTKMRSEVFGYVEPSRITQANSEPGAPDTRGLPTAQAPASTPEPDNAPLPF